MRKLTPVKRQINVSLTLVWRQINVILTRQVESNRSLKSIDVSWRKNYDWRQDVRQLESINNNWRQLMHDVTIIIVTGTSSVNWRQMTSIDVNWRTSTWRQASFWRHDERQSASKYDVNWRQFVHYVIITL